MSPRASTRLKDRPQVSLAETTADRDQEFVQSDALAPIKPTRSKKRKISESANKGKVVGGSKPKKLKGNRGLLRALVEMPLDILLEIFACLQPLDLLHLARTSKALRALLMTRSAVSVWKKSFLNVPDPSPPECPGDRLNEPQYAELLYGKACTFCGKSVGKIHRMWAARVRVCTNCLDVHFEEMEWVKNKPYGEELYTLLPTLRLDRKYGRHARGTVFIYPPIDKDWLEAYESIDSTAAKRRWLKDKIKEQTVIANHAEACSDWVLAVQELVEDEKETAIEARKAIIIKRIHHLGWGDELDRLPISYYGPGDLSIVLKACRKDLTEAVLASLDEHLITFMERIKAERLEREHHVITDERLRDLRTARDHCIATLPVNYIHPTTGELFQLPFIQGIIATLAPTASFSEDDLELIKRSFNDINQQWQKGVESRLRDIASKGYKEDADPETVVSLATTFFVCTSCSSRYLRYPSVLMHKCRPAANVLGTGHDDRDFMTGSSRSSEGEIYWNNEGTIVVKPEQMEFMASVVSLTGLDPKTATALDMDALDPIFECVSCNDFQEGRTTMSWTTTIVHAYEPYAKHSIHRGMGLESAFEPILLDESEAQLIRPRMRDARERNLRRASAYSSIVTVCAICKQRGSFVDLWLHLKQDHGKTKPTSEDIVPTPEQIPPIYLHWPPRDDLKNDNFEGDEDCEEDENFEEDEDFEEDENFEEFGDDDNYERDENSERDDNF